MADCEQCAALVVLGMPGQKCEKHDGPAEEDHTEIIESMTPKRNRQE